MARKDGLVVRELPDETVVYDTQRHKAHCLGPLLAALWRECDGRSTARQIGARLRRQSSIAVDEEVVAVALLRLARARLLEKGRAINPHASRRDVLKTVAALGGLSLLSITAPTPLQAATCIPTATCNADNPPCPGLPCCETPSLRCKATVVPGGGGAKCECRG